MNKKQAILILSLCLLCSCATSRQEDSRYEASYIKLRNESLAQHRKLQLNRSLHDGLNWLVDLGAYILWLKN